MYPVVLNSETPLIYRHKTDLPTCFDEIIKIGGRVYDPVPFTTCNPIHNSNGYLRVSFRTRERGNERLGLAVCTGGRVLDRCCSTRTDLDLTCEKKGKKQILFLKHTMLRRCEYFILASFYFNFVGKNTHFLGLEKKKGKNKDITCHAGRNCCRRCEY